MVIRIGADVEGGYGASGGGEILGRAPTYQPDGPELGRWVQEAIVGGNGETELTYRLEKGGARA